MMPACKKYMPEVVRAAKQTALQTDTGLHVMSLINVLLQQQLSRAGPCKLLPPNFTDAPAVGTRGGSGMHRLLRQLGSFQTTGCWFGKAWVACDSQEMI